MRRAQTRNPACRRRQNRAFRLAVSGQLQWPYAVNAPILYWPRMGTFQWPPTCAVGAVVMFDNVYLRRSLAVWYGSSGRAAKHFGALVCVYAGSNSRRPARRQRNAMESRRPLLTLVRVRVTI